MEVHHHSHTARKKWTHYLWEFLMLFLAVFCGFLAENQREHMIEHQREKQFMRSLLKDLESDTANFNRSITVFQSNVQWFDSLKSSIKYPRSPEDILNAYKASTLVQNFSSFNYSDRTIEQLRSAGNFRLIRRTAVSDSIILYDRYIRHTYLALEKIVEQHSLQLSNMQNDLFDYDASNFLLSINFYDRFAVPVDSFPLPLKLLTHNEQQLAHFYNSFGTYRNWCQRIATHSRIARKGATRLIEIIKKEYHL